MNSSHNSKGVGSLMVLVRCIKKVEFSFLGSSSLLQLLTEPRMKF